MEQSAVFEGDGLGDEALGTDGAGKGEGSGFGTAQPEAGDTGGEDDDAGDDPTAERGDGGGGGVVLLFEFAEDLGVGEFLGLDLLGKLDGEVGDGGFAEVGLGEGGRGNGAGHEAHESTSGVMAKSDHEGFPERGE